MPGILPMKVIKVGTAAQSRIAQACDRCRSKKIRCDGIRPCCTQCSNVGFECKTSDKLSRRAFPRGYTESLEERVRALESEVRELKDLLDEKDEKIDMLTRIHPQTSPSQSLSPRRTSATPSSASPKTSSASPAPKEDSFKVQQSPYLSEDGTTESYFVGTSSGKTFIDAFKNKVQEKGRSAADIKAESLLSTSAKQQSKTQEALQVEEWKAPPRLVSDQMVNIFFQEWAPLFPILHRPTFLSLYAEYTADPESVTDKAQLAQLNLVFGLAAVAHGSQQVADIDLFESQWRAALAAIQTEQNMPTLQCLLLAQLYCIQRGDYNKLLTYKALAISLSSRLGLHQSQKRFALGTLTCETRKKVFWTLYTVDSFSAVLLGLPKQLKDDDVHCEMPVDADDEYISERGFQPALPGESTRLSSALALFRVTRILSRVLEEVYPALPSYELSLQKLSSLAEELDQWSTSLAPHLRLPFAQDKPTVGTVSSRSPLLSLTYHYVRALIHRPAVCASLGSRSSSSVMAMASSCKHIIQIVQLLAERGLSFSFCLNKDELLVLSGFGLLYQNLDLDKDSKVLKDNQKSLAGIMKLLDQSKAGCAAEFRRVAGSFLPVATQAVTVQRSDSAAPRSRHNSEGAKPATHHSSFPPSLKQQFKAMTAKFMPPPRSAVKDQRRATEPELTYQSAQSAQSQPTLSPYDELHVTRSEPARSPSGIIEVESVPARPSAPPSLNSHPAPRLEHMLNLDYLSFGNNTPQTSRSPPIKPEPSEWERLLGNLDNGQTNIFDSMYGGPPVEMLQDTGYRRAPLTHSISNFTDDDWSSDIWALTSADLAPVHSASAVTESVLSFSTDEGPLSNCGFDLPDDASVNHDAFRGIVMPHDLASSDDGLLGTGWELSLAS